jgi:hypothetical protein
MSCGNRDEPLAAGSMSANACSRQLCPLRGMVCGMKLAAVALLPLFSALCFPQTKPLSVCDLLNKPDDWDNQLVLVRAHYGSGMEDSFLHDEHCPSQQIWFDYPEAAAKEDAVVNDKLAQQRIPVSLKRDRQLVHFEKYASVRDPAKPMCPGLDIVLTAHGRVDTKRDTPLNKNCREPFGMCNYRARLVLESIQDVSVSDSKPLCK